MGTLEELEKSGKDDDGLRTAVSEGPQDLPTLQYIGQRIGELAEDLKD